MDGRSNRRNKTAFPNFSDILWPLQPKGWFTLATEATEAES